MRANKLHQYTATGVARILKNNFGLTNKLGDETSRRKNIAIYAQDDYLVIKITGQNPYAFAITEKHMRLLMDFFNGTGKNGAVWKNANPYTHWKNE